MTHQHRVPPPLPPQATHHDLVRRAAYVLHHLTETEVGHRAWATAGELIVQEMQHRQAMAAHPLRFLELWRPECRTCIDWTWPGTGTERGPVNAIGKPCGAKRPGADGRTHGVPMVHIEGLRHRCPVCGVEEERTSQRQLVRDVLRSTALAVVALGSNRSSKTFSGSIVGILTTLGADHPDVRWMLQANDIEPGRLPRGLGFVQCGSITHGDSRNYLRPYYDAFLPRDWRWSGRFAEAEAYVCHPAAGSGLPGSVLFKTTTGPAIEAKWQGTSSPLVHVDEDHGNVAVLGEQLRAVADQGGRLLVTATPTKGKSPAMVDLLFRDPPRAAGDVERFYLDALDNPMVDGDAMARWFASMGDRERRIRRFAEFVRVEGLVHPGFDRAVHVVPALPAEEMADWPRVDGLDFGYRAPFAYVWGAVAPDGVLHVYRVRYEREIGTDEHVYEVLRAESCPSCWPGSDGWGSDVWWRTRADAAAKCQTCEGTGRAHPEPWQRFADPADAGARHRWAELGLPTEAANKARRAGFELLDRLMAIRDDGRPGLVIHDRPSTAPLVTELEGLGWRHEDPEKRTGKAERVEMEVDPRTPDHAWDALRYLAMGAASLGFLS